MEQRPIRDAGDQWIAAWERREGKSAEALIEEYLGPGDAEVLGGDPSPADEQPPEYDESSTDPER